MLLKAQDEAHLARLLALVDVRHLGPTRSAEQVRFLGRKASLDHRLIDLVLDLGGVNFNDITTAAYSAKLDPSRFITVGLNDVRIGDEVIAGVRLADVLAELAKLKPPSAPYRGTPQGLAPVNGKPSDKITMDALYPRYAAFLRAGDTIVLETGSTSPGITPMVLPDGVRPKVQTERECQETCYGFARNRIG